MRGCLLLILLLLLFTHPVTAQEPTPLPDVSNPSLIEPEISATAVTATPESSLPTIPYDVPVTGTLNSTTPSEVYRFEGLRGDVIEIALRVTEGDLDPVLTLLDSAGSLVVNRDDTAGSSGRDIQITSLRLPTSDAYTLMIARYGYALGTTAGDYTLQIERIGASADTGGALRYGDSIISEVDDGQPAVYFTFRARRGDILAVAMRKVSGNLDAFLQVTDASGVIIAENDDVQGSGSLDALVNSLIMPDDGVYVIIASRFGGAAGPSTGSFVLSLDVAANTTLGASALEAIPLLAGDVVEGELTSDRYAQFYRFEGSRDNVISIRMARAEDGTLDTLLALADANLQEIATNDDSDGTQNSAIREFVLPTDGTYYIIATRFERENGLTTGAYTLALESSGSAFAQVAPDALRLDYGTPITGVIDEVTSQVLYAFQGSAGDIVTITMNRSNGDLDPRIFLLDEQLNELVNDDDSGGEQNARIERFSLPADGVYYLQATRYVNPAGGPLTRGGYLLIVSRAN